MTFDQQFIFAATHQRGIRHCGVSLVVLVGWLVVLATAQARVPNIVLLFADDVGQEVLGCYGGESYRTPNIDRLAETGMRFEHCYTMPLCSPSRTCLLTGKYPFRTGTHLPKTWGTIHAEETTFAHLLQRAGYKTCLTGKWQMNLLKHNPRFPMQMGFDEYFVFGWHEGPRYHDPFIYKNAEARSYPGEYGPELYCNYCNGEKCRGCWLSMSYVSLIGA